MRQTLISNLFICFTLVNVSNLWSKTSDIYKEIETFHCSLNKSHTLVIYEMYENSSLTTIRLEKMNFDGDLLDSITLKNSRVISYENSYVIFADHGRSGFASINIVHDNNYDTGFSGYINLNLFSTKFYTPGVLTTWCHKMPSSQIFQKK